MSKIYKIEMGPGRGTVSVDELTMEELREVTKLYMDTVRLYRETSRDLRHELDSEISVRQSVDDALEKERKRRAELQADLEYLACEMYKIKPEWTQLWALSRDITLHLEKLKPMNSAWLETAKALAGDIELRERQLETAKQLVEENRELYQALADSESEDKKKSPA
jgi:chromosome segregation ATPase